MSENQQIDSLGNTIDVLLPKKRAVLLLDKEDYVYLSQGYQTQEGTEDLLRTVKVKMDILQLEDYTVLPLPRGLWRRMSASDRKQWFK